jgi:threonyl-tRNA synthetase
VSLRSRREGDLGSVAVADLLASAGLANTRRAAGLDLAPPPQAPT